MKSGFVTRKEIAEAAGISEDTVVRKEEKWGLDECRSQGSENPILYFREKASVLLLKLKVISKPL